MSVTMANERRKDRHKEAKQVRVNVKLASALEKLAERNATTIPIEVNRAVRELLEREGLWPSRRE